MSALPPSGINPAMVAVRAAASSTGRVDLSPALQQELLVAVVQEVHALRVAVERLQRGLLVVAAVAAGSAGTAKLLEILQGVP